MNNRIEEIEKEIEKLDSILDIKEKDWDNNYREKHNNESDLGFSAYCDFRQPELAQLSKLERELRFIKHYKLSTLSTFGNVMALEDFIGNCKSGGFIDYDGFGRYVKDGQETDIEIYPSDVKHNSVRKEFDTIIWFNR